MNENFDKIKTISFKDVRDSIYRNRYNLFNILEELKDSYWFEKDYIYFKTNTDRDFCESFYLPNPEVLKSDYKYDSLDEGFVYKLKNNVVVLMELPMFDCRIRDKLISYIEEDPSHPIFSVNTESVEVIGLSDKNILLGTNFGTENNFIYEPKWYDLKKEETNSNYPFITLLSEIRIRKGSAEAYKFADKVFSHKRLDLSGQDLKSNKKLNKWYKNLM